MIRCIGVNSEHAGSSGRNRRTYTQRCRGNFPSVDRDRSMGDGLSAGKRLLRNRGDGAIHVPVYIRDIRDGGCLVDDGRVVDIRHLSHVHGGIAHVNLVDVVSAHRIRRHIHFTRAQREPGHIAADSAAANEHD